MWNRIKNNRNLVLLPVLFILWIIWGNFTLGITEYEIASDRIPKSFDGFRIAQISDLHNAQFGKDNCNLLKKLTQADPDIIVITGDMIDSRRTDIQIALDLAAEMTAICPVYYVTGNHESRISEYKAFKTGMEEIGVIVLEDRRDEIVLNDERIMLIGVQDPSFRVEDLHNDAESAARKVIERLRQGFGGYTVLLSHRPELFEIYVNTGVDLVFSGHTHGGQFRLPIVGGLVAPNQGFFPKYDAGLFAEKNTMMIICRGIGNSIMPIRFYNRPEISVAELNSLK